MTTTTGGIAVFDQYPFMGGGQVLLLSIIPAALEVAGNVTVVAPMGGGLEAALRKEFGAQIKTRNVTLPSLTHGKKGLLDVFRLVIGTIRMLPTCLSVALRSRLLYANGPRLFPVLMLVSLISRRACCYHVHINFGPLERVVLLWASRLSTTWKIILNSEDTYHNLVAVAPQLAVSKKLIVIENGLSRRYESISYQNRITPLPAVWNVVVFGVLRPEKGQDIAVDAVRHLTNIKLHIVGRIGEGAETWADDVKRAAPQNVQFHDAVPDIIQFIDAHRIHVNLVPSRWAEPFGLVAIEGMAASCVTVVSESGALLSLAQRTGALSFNGTVGDLARVLAELTGSAGEWVDSIARRQFHSTMLSYGSNRLVSDLKAMLQGGLDATRDA